MLDNYICVSRSITYDANNISYIQVAEKQTIEEGRRDVDREIKGKELLSNKMQIVNE